MRGRVIHCVDAHAEGEPSRIIVGGVLDVPGATMLEKMQRLEREGDELRRLLLFEPRGSAPLSAFTDAAWGTVDVPGASGRFFGDAGVGASLSGALYDQSYTVRVDLPLWTRSLGAGSDGTVNWVVSLSMK